jgi:hypothetical protein
MTGEDATARIDILIVGIDGGKLRLTGGRRRKSHRTRDVEELVEVEIIAHRQARPRAAIDIDLVDAEIGPNAFLEAA